MGVKPTPTEYCNRCTDCFPTNGTPETVKLFVSGIRIGDLWTDDWIYPPNGVFTLDVYEALPCRWSGNFPGPVHIDLRSSASSQALQITTGPATVFGDSSVDQPCRRHFTNQVTNPATSIWYGGHAHFYTSEEMVELIEKITPMIDPIARMECWPIADKHNIIRYAGTRDKTSFYFDLDTDP